MEIVLARPTYLYLLFFIPLIVLIHFLTLKLRRSYALKFANFSAIARIKDIDVYSKNIFILVITVLILCAITFSLAGVAIQTEASSSDFSFVIAVDSSKSMEALDISPTRLEAAKRESLSFTDSTPLGTKIGVVSFSGNSLIEQKVVNDKQMVKNAIKNIDFGIAGGTDIYEAIVTSINLLEGYNKKAIILLSDGQINVGSLQDAVDYANKNEVIVHTFAIGTKEGGGTSYGISKLDEDSLKSIAYNTKGIFSSATNGDELAYSFKKVVDAKIGKVSFDISQYLQAIALILLIFLFILVNTRLRAFP
jgi:Ca-activated chloride channel family protein